MKNVCISMHAPLEHDILHSLQGSVPLDLRIRRIRLPAKFHQSVKSAPSHCSFANALDFNIPVTTLTWEIPWESRRTTPI